MESGVEFTACDFPQANRLTVHILAAVAEHEAKAISDRTKQALAAAKRRGKVLGGFRGSKISAAAREIGQRAIQERTRNRAADIAPVIADLRAEGIISLNGTH
jgi:DNA invertase Pin-like site-specific DNA recombinase